MKGLLEFSLSIQIIVARKKITWSRNRITILSRGCTSFKCRQLNSTTNLSSWCTHCSTGRGSLLYEQVCGERAGTDSNSPIRCNVIGFEHCETSWSMTLQVFSPQIEHIAGVWNTHTSMIFFLTM